MRGDSTYSRVMLHAAAGAGRMPAWEGYARYCRLRDQGLRREAFRSLDDFLHAAERWAFEERREFAAWLSELLAPRESRHDDLTPHPLIARLLRPTLLEWVEREPGAVLPHRWLGIFFSGYPHAQDGLSSQEHLRRAIELDPGEQPARIRLIHDQLAYLEYAMHHLPDYFIGDPEEDQAFTGEVARLIERVADPRTRSELQAELASARQLVEDWIAFRDEGGADFDEWCRVRGRTYEWQRHYFYPSE
ncbi:MAG TPA: hypothetical protein VK420_02815 [Longimicrobium sp.]|nr:hypothetical protein [Longimicrobium sp.]